MLALEVGHVFADLGHVLLLLLDYLVDAGLDVTLGGGARLDAVQETKGVGPVLL